MRSLLKRLCPLCIVLLMSVVCSGCTSGQDGAAAITIVEESYDHSSKNAFYPRPSFTGEGSRQDVLTVNMEDGLFFCFTTDTAQADDFINAQRTLLYFLADHGVEAGKLTYYATDYDDSFSDSGKKAAYIALSSVRTYQQVLVTLQSLWGDYTDYGYVYAMANAIAVQLRWQTDGIEPVEKTSLDAFFSETPAAICLLYPCFSTKFASEETVNCCKTLSSRLFEEIDLSAVLAVPIEVQLDDYYILVGTYAEEISVPFIRQTCGYAYYGEYLPLRILTSYAQLMVDNDYLDFNSDLYGDYFSDYESIFKTANTIDAEIIAAVESFDLETEAGILSINWLSGDSAIRKFGKELANYFEASLQEVYVTTIQGYLHEYYHHIEHLLSSDLGECWQSQAFCEIGRAHSQYAQYAMETPFTQREQMIELFTSCTGRSYQPGLDDYYEAYDILCYIAGEYELDYYAGGNAINSFNRYLINLYGENTVCDLMLSPETAEDITGKTWDELEAEWKQYIRNKYVGVEIPDWVNN